MFKNTYGQVQFYDISIGGLKLYMIGHHIERKLSMFTFFDRNLLD